MEGDYRRCGDCNAYLGFQSTPSAWRETYVSSDAFAASHISIHSLRMEGDRPHPRWTQFRSHFNPLPPHGGRHWIDGFFDKFAKISIHSLRMEGDAYCGAIRRTRKRISIHSLRMEGDNDFGYNLISDNISIHSLRMEGDDTHSGKNRQKTYFNPLPPHGGRRISSYHSGILRAFQSTPSAWRETLSVPEKQIGRAFQSTPSAWRETSGIGRNAVNFGISIHSLRMEGDHISPDS